MSSYVWLKETLSDYLYNIQESRRGRIGLVVLAGVGLSILAGYLLRQQRRKYRPVAPKDTPRVGLYRANTFREAPLRSLEEEPMLGASSLSPRTESSILSDKIDDEQVDHSSWEAVRDEDTHSISSDDSFHSTVESLLEASTQDIKALHRDVGPHALYLDALEVVATGAIHCRTNRTKMLHCESDNDFLAKVHCVRQAFDCLVRSEDNRQYFMTIARNIMADFLHGADQDPGPFTEQFTYLVHFMEDNDNWAIAENELTKRKVGAMNIYDIGVDFILLDAFDDLESPPSAFISVLQNTWITNGMKRSALSAALWSILKAKKSLLKHKNGFMSHFYILSETITPTLAWGFLGTDNELKIKCEKFQSVVLKFIRSVFSVECVRYTTVNDMAQDVLRLAQEAAETMHHFHNSD